MVDFTAYREVSLKEMLQTGGGAAGGITVRDYFAATALQGIVHDSDIFWEGAAPLAYQYADAMMKVRNKRPEEPTPTVEEAFKL